MIIGTAGHIDHGKTALIKALTGTDADRLKEEKTRGITIELGFAYWPQADGSVIGFVDVPGHERFVHTMLMGAQGVDLALLVVAADDGIMPQTREHLDILRLAGLSRMVVALTKADKVDAGRLVDVGNAVAMLLAPTDFAGAPVFAVSSLTGAGMAALAAHLAAEAARLAPRADTQGFRLAVDRCFTLAGAGTVVTGMVLDGVVRLDDEVIVSPSGLKTRVRAIHAQNRAAPLGRAGERCALNLAGVAKSATHRGDMIVAPAFHAPTQRFDAELMLADLPRGGLQPWMPARLHHATADIGARLLPLEDMPHALGRQWVQVVLEQPLAARALDRFILRDVSASRTLAGGMLVDLRPPTRKRRTPQRLARLAAMAKPDTAQALSALAALGEPLDLGTFARDRGLMLAGVTRQAEAAGFSLIEDSGSVHALPAESIDAAKQRAIAALTAFHAAEPDLAGLGLERLRLIAAPALPAPLFRQLLRQWTRDGTLALDGNWIRLASHTVKLSDEDERLRDEVLPRLSGTERFRPPRVRDLARELAVDEPVMRRLCKRLERLGVLHEVAQDHFFPRPVVAELVRLAAATPPDLASGMFSAAAFRDAIEAVGGPVGRKVAIHILECLDRHGVTIRRGDGRRMNPHRLDLFEPAREV